MQIKNILLPQNLKLSIFFIGADKFLIFKNLSNTRYVSVPLSVLCNKKDNVLTLICDSKDLTAISQFNQFVTRVEIAIRTLNNTFKRKLTLKGLGFRITLIEKKQVEFKLGFSHLIRLNIPQNIKVRTKKNFMFLESSDIILLGNFVYKVISLKLPDSYKGKGFWSKYQKKTLKIIKKK